MPDLSLLLVDFLDSYTHNIPALVRRARPPGVLVDVHVVPYTALNAADVAPLTAKYHGVLLSAGPGTVDSHEDLGSFVPALLQREPAAVPVFGICLGFQAICTQFGGRVQRLSMPHHGLVSEIESRDGTKLGRSATRYHSLEVQLTPELERNVEPESCAWSANHNDASRTLQEAKIRGRPFWGVQYHPESVRSSGCEVVLQPFLREVAARAESAVPRRAPSSGSRSRSNSPDSETASTGLTTPSTPPSLDEKEIAWVKLDGQLDIPALIRADFFPDKEFVVLDSAGKDDWDILSFAASASSFRYSCRQHTYSFTLVSDLRRGQPDERHPASLDDAWAFLRSTATKTTYTGGPDEVPFRGGFLGYFSYELGLEQLGLDPYPRAADGARAGDDDIQLLWSSETVLHSSRTNSIYLLSLARDHAWLKSTAALLTNLARHPPPPPLLPTPGNCTVTNPSKEEYLASIAACKAYMRAGDAYELCLTAPTRVSLAASIAPAALYTALRKSNPARFSAYMSLAGTTILSASPEHFLSFDAATRKAHMTPIKGTLPTRRPDGTPVTLDEARRAVARDAKMQAENLMIVDLVRNDLARVAGWSTSTTSPLYASKAATPREAEQATADEDEAVSVPALLHLTQHPHVFQLSSTIAARIPPSRTAFDLLAAALPAGSMTGAPKRRACALLQTLEGGVPRGVYSGALGFVDVRGGCCFSVGIRNAVRQREGEGGAVWSVGAGGAVTVLSDALGEWEERGWKAGSVLGAFAA